VKVWQLDLGRVIPSSAQLGPVDVARTESKAPTSRCVVCSMKLSLYAAFIVVALLATASLAHADVVGVNCNPDESFTLCAGLYVVESSPIHNHGADIWVGFPREHNTARRCTLTIVHTLYDERTGRMWTVPNPAKDCSAALPSSPYWEPYGKTYWGTFTGTTATTAWVDACVDLYWGTSRRSGWQQCAQSQQVTLRQ
jgi:hypothetical protein